MNFISVFLLTFSYTHNYILNACPLYVYNTISLLQVRHTHTLLADDSNLIPL